MVRMVRMVRMLAIAVVGGAMFLVKLLGPVGTLKFVALTGKGEQGDSQQQDGK
ncbi:MAG: hypothetical protein WED15_02435 [Akkermansiaceae bacterium]